MAASRLLMEAGVRWRPRPLREAVQRLEVATDRQTLLAPFGQSGLVLLAHCPCLGLSFLRSHGPIFVHFHRQCKAPGCGVFSPVILPNLGRLRNARLGQNPRSDCRKTLRRGAPRYGGSVAADPDDPGPLHRALGLTDDELAAIEGVLGRAPNHLELALYAVMWSEHCSYKSSRVHLRRLPTEGARVLVGPGENAGVVDAGDGIALAIRIESHNHPSAIEPHQGAATGVGGILRDIFTMGARPLAVMDPLFFGPPDDPRRRWLVEGVVAGISAYGNSVGVPTVGGELTFDPCYRQNPLVNVLCLGALPTDRLVLGAASGVGNLAVLLGSTTGRDGIGGVSVLASAGFGADEAVADAKRPSVQVGDPFEEKRLIEACLDLLGRAPRRGHPGPGRGGARVRDERDRRARRGRDGRRRARGAAARAEHGALGGDDERDPGADARDRDPGRVAGGQGGVRALGGDARRSSGP